MELIARKAHAGFERGDQGARGFGESCHVVEYSRLGAPGVSAVHSTATSWERSPCAAYNLLVSYRLPHDAALAYLITFRCYGTWLHGDDRGSIDRWHNQYGGELLAARPSLEAREREVLKGPPFALDAPRRAAVAAALEAEAGHYRWTLHVVHVRTNHVHVVVSAPEMPEKVLNMLKAAATRCLRQANLLGPSDRCGVLQHPIPYTEY